MSLSKKTYSSIQRVLRNRTFRVAMNETWMAIHSEFGIGRVSAKHLLLTSDDHEKLRSWASLEAGADPLTTIVTGDRLEAASLARDEKWATDGVFSGMIQVTRLSGAIPLIQGNAVTPPGTLLSVAADDIRIDGVGAVILVENGTVARHWNQCRIPDDLSSALVVYRGHAKEAATVRSWLDGLPPSVRKIGFFDFDPAGLGIAIDYAMENILIPDPLDDELVRGSNNKPDAHVEQLMRRPDLRKQLPESCHTVWDWMMSDQRKCAVTQERLMILGWPLRVLMFMRA